MQTRMPHEFRQLLRQQSEDYLSVWLVTKVTVDEQVRNAAAAFDVYSLIVAVEEDDTVVQGRVYYCDIRMWGRTVQEVIQEAAERMMESADCTVEGTIVQMLEEEDVSSVLMK